LSLSYTFKRLIRSWGLFIALFLGIVLASTFFAGINVGADTAAKQALDQLLSQVPVDLYVNAYSALSSRNVTNIVQDLSTVEGVKDVEAVSRISVFQSEPLDDIDVVYKGSFKVVGVSNNSHVYDGWVGGAPSSWEKNETYVWVDSTNADLWEEGSIIPINITVPTYKNGNFTELRLQVNLTVAGFVRLEDKALSLAQGTYYYIQPFGIGGPSNFMQIYPIPENLLIVSWNQTLAPLLDTVYELSPSYGPISTDFLVFVDRGSIISIWDIPGSLARLDVIKRHIDQKLWISGYSLPVISTLDSILLLYQFTSGMMRLSFIVVSLPVFFVAWYMGTTVSDVSFNLRRREIGLLLTKGFSRRQLLRMFLTEALLIGLIGGIIGIALSLVLNPLFVMAIGGVFIGTPQIGTDTAVLTVIFSVIITFLVVFRPARRASNLATVDALREYRYVEDVKPYKRTWPWVAFLLGTYKLVIFLLGINLFYEMTRISMSGNFLLVLLLGIWTVFDTFVLTPPPYGIGLGPLLFFWGFTKIFIRGSLKFQEVTARAARFLGDLGVLATRNVQRNPARAASIAFLIALIMGYGIQITGILASDQDYNIRTVYANVGADVSVWLNPPLNVSATNSLRDTLIRNVSGIASTALEYSFYGSSSFAGLQLKAVNTSEWLNTTYYEDGWFSGRDIKTAFQLLSSDNHTIVLERDVAETNNLKLGDRIRVGFDRWFGMGQYATDLTIVGFFGGKRPETTFFGQTVGVQAYWSYVSEGLFKELGPAVTNSSSVRLLVKLDGGVNGTVVANQIRDIVPRNQGSVYSVSEQLEEQQSNLMYVGTLNVQRLGVAFAILATSVGTALVALASLKERQREASIMGVRGLSFRQLAVMLLTENLAVVTFAVLLGALVGLLVVHWNAASFASTTLSLVSKRVVFPPDALLTILAYFGLVFASTIVPVILMTKRYVSRLERVV